MLHLLGNWITACREVYPQQHEMANLMPSDPLARCADILKAGKYRVAIYSASPEVKIAAELFEQETGIITELIPKSTHDEML
ncbi:MAG: hypothetical protein C0410_08435, partial [Anaerolinea sp.]|nr:hypothetical protein [Anaerolinea sp.]